MKEKIGLFIHGLILQDYILFGSVLVLFVLFLVLTLVFRKRLGISIFFLLLSLVILFLGPSLGYIQMHNFLFKNSVAITEEKRLTFVEALVIKGTLKNESNLDFQSCKITASVNKMTSNVIKNYIYTFKPLMNMSIIEEDIKKGESREFKIIMDPFRFQIDYNISIIGKCE